MQSVALKIENNFSRLGEEHCWLLTLWGAVLQQAIVDARKHKGYSYNDQWHPQQPESIRWLLNRQNSPTSFVWVCELLGVHPDWARRTIFARIGGKNDLPKETDS